MDRLSSINTPPRPSQLQPDTGNNSEGMIATILLTLTVAMAIIGFCWQPLAKPMFVMATLSAAALGALAWHYGPLRLLEQVKKANPSPPTRVND